MNLIYKNQNVIFGLIIQPSPEASSTPPKEKRPISSSKDSAGTESTSSSKIVPEKADHNAQSSQPAPSDKKDGPVKPKPAQKQVCFFFFLFDELESHL